MCVGDGCRLPGVAATVVVLLLAGVAQAQGQWQPWSPGIRGGLNLSAVIYGDPVASGVGLKQGWHAGFSASRPLLANLGLEASLLWSQDGYAGDGVHPGDVEMTYLDVPVVAKLHLPGRISPYVTVGLDLGYMVACRITGVHLVDVAPCDDPMVGTRWRALDLGAVLGLGWAVPWDPGTLTLDALIDLGVRDIKADVLPPGTARRAALRFSMAWFPGEEVGS